MTIEESIEDLRNLTITPKLSRGPSSLRRWSSTRKVGMGVGGGGLPPKDVENGREEPHDPGMEARIAVLEEIARETKSGLSDIKSEMKAFRAEVSVDNKALRSEFLAAIAGQRSDFQAELREQRSGRRAEFLWMLGMMLALLGVMAHGFKWL